MDTRMILRLIALLTLVLGLIMLFNLPGSEYLATRYIHAILGVLTIALMEVVLARVRRKV